MVHVQKSLFSNDISYFSKASTRVHSDYALCRGVVLSLAMGWETATLHILAEGYQHCITYHSRQCVSHIVDPETLLS